MKKLYPKMLVLLRIVTFAFTKPETVEFKLKQ